MHAFSPLKSPVIRCSWVSKFTWVAPGGCCASSDGAVDPQIYSRVITHWAETKDICGIPLVSSNIIHVLTLSFCCAICNTPYYDTGGFGDELNWMSNHLLSQWCLRIMLKWQTMAGKIRPQTPNIAPYNGWLLRSTHNHQTALLWKKGNKSYAYYSHSV